MILSDSAVKCFMLNGRSILEDEHMLLALLRFPESNAMKIIQQLGVDLEMVRSKIHERLQQN